MVKFKDLKIGDKVKIDTKDGYYDGRNLNGMIGTVVGFNHFKTKEEFIRRLPHLANDENNITINICWDKVRNGHSSNGECKQSDGWDVYSNSLKKVKSHPKYSKHIAQLNFDESFKNKDIIEENKAPLKIGDRVIVVKNSPGNNNKDLIGKKGKIITFYYGGYKKEYSKYAGVEFDDEVCTEKEYGNSVPIETTKPTHCLWYESINLKKISPKYSKHIAQLNFDESLNEDVIPDEIILNVREIKGNDSKIKKLEEKLKSLGYKTFSHFTSFKNMVELTTSHIYVSKFDTLKRGSGSPYENYKPYNIKKLLPERKQPHYVAQLNFDESTLNEMKITDRLLKPLMEETFKKDDIVYISTDNWNIMFDGNRSLKRYPDDDYMKKLKPFFVNKILGKVTDVYDNGTIDVKFNEFTFGLKNEFVTKLKEGEKTPSPEKSKEVKNLLGENKEFRDVDGNILKVGDRVERIDRSLNYYGKRATIKGFYGVKVYIEFDDFINDFYVKEFNIKSGYGWSSSSESLKKINKKPKYTKRTAQLNFDESLNEAIETFKVGDKVKVIEDFSYEFKGDIGTIVGFEHNIHDNGPYKSNSGVVVNVIWKNFTDGHDDFNVKFGTKYRPNAQWNFNIGLLRKVKSHPKYSKHIAQLNFDENLNEGKINFTDEIAINVKNEEEARKVFKQAIKDGYVVDERRDYFEPFNFVYNMLKNYGENSLIYFYKNDRPAYGSTKINNNFYTFKEYINRTPKYSKHIAQLKFDEKTDLLDSPQLMEESLDKLGDEIKKIVKKLQKEGKVKPEKIAERVREALKMDASKEEILHRYFSTSGGSWDSQF